MPNFSDASKKQLDTCILPLQKLAYAAIRYVNFTVLEGHRGEEAQNKDFREGKSKLQWPNGNHNKFPSYAFDVAPYPIDWGSDIHKKARFYYLAGVMFQEFNRLQEDGLISGGLALRWGGDWDGDKDFSDQTFDDLGHYEIVNRVES